MSNCASKSKYFQLPLFVEALRWTGDCEGCVMDFIAGMTQPFEDGSLSIATKRGDIIVMSGDWIVKYENEEVSVVSNEVFEMAFGKCKTQ